MDPYTFRSFDKIYVGGSWETPVDGGAVDIVSPVTEEVIGHVMTGGKADIDRAVAAARTAFDEGPWPRLTPAERADYLRRAIEAIERRVPEMVASFTAEVGTPVNTSEAFLAIPKLMWEDAASAHERFAFEEVRHDGGQTVTVTREPVGVVAAVIPWNGPVGEASFKMAPALAAGCTVVLKPSTDGPGSVMVFTEALDEVGFPEGVISVIPGGREVGEHLVAHPDVDKVAFTGSTAAGKKIMASCAERITRVTLELGGKGAAIVLEDARFDEVVPVLIPAGIGHSGQICAAMTRILVPESRHDEFVAAAKEFMEGVVVGDPTSRDTVLGPLVAQRQYERVTDYIRLGVEEGATLVTGGGRPDHLDRGWYVAPTLFANVSNQMRIAREEIFGPVVVVIPYADVDEAVAIANDSPYGLSGSVYTADPEVGEAIARRIRAGQVSVNSSDLNILQPFGGYKQSGLGRAGNVEGISGYVETKVLQGV